jgi:hypothetical protein
MLQITKAHTENGGSARCAHSIAKQRLDKHLATEQF